MSTTHVTPSSQNEYLQYRAVSLPAVATLILGIISVPAIFFSTLLILPLAGILLGIYSLIQLNRRRDELTGLNMSRMGLAICTLVFVIGVSYSGYVYATEVPEGYLRISFSELQPEKGSRLPIPASAMELNGQQVFVKGYIHPGISRKRGLKQFVLVPDMKTCCFGGQPKLTDMIEVTLKDPLRVDYSLTRRKLAGVLKVSPYKKAVTGLDGVYYQLEADHVR